MSINDSLNTLSKLMVGDKEYKYYSLAKFESENNISISKLPISIRILLENVIRNFDGNIVNQKHLDALIKWGTESSAKQEIPYHPARVILQDFTGVPCVVDLASMRSAVEQLGANPSKINPVVPVDLVIDHSVQVDYFASEDAFQKNVEREYERNRERYQFLKWAQNSFDNFQVVPPGTGIVHQVNLEYLAKVVATKIVDDTTIVFPDTLVGTDSHTTMINGLSVMGWGVGGIEADSCMLGQPMFMLVPEVVGFKLYGELSEGVTATDLVLRVTEMLREKGVVGKFVEFYGSGLSKLALSDKATISNMAPEYGATMGFFPVDSENLNYLKQTGRDKDLIDLVEAYTKEQQLFRTDNMADPIYTDSLELDISSVEPALAGPRRPQDRIPLSKMQDGYNKSFAEVKASVDNGNSDVNIDLNGSNETIGHGSVVIAAITSCTNTSNPSVMVAAGLLAKNAVEKGLKVNPTVKTSLAPGSRVVTDYLNNAGLTKYLEALGFNLVGYGCTTCIGNSGPLPEAIETAIRDNDLICSSVLSGNRNFEGRIHPHIKFSYLASPPLVVAYSLAGTVDIDLFGDPIGINNQGNEVYLRDIWPTQEEIRSTVSNSLDPEMYNNRYSKVFDGDDVWNSFSQTKSELYSWDNDSTYIRELPFFKNLSQKPSDPEDIKGANVLALLGDSITTDHISPAGAIPQDGPAGKYLVSKGVEKRDFNSFGSRRGNHEVMMRGTFANIRIKNRLAPGTEGGWTVHIPSGEKMSIYDASMKYQSNNTSLLVIGGKEYGTGSSRDWAAKGTILLGVKCVIAESYERIHRSNLVGMGVLPLQFKEGDSAVSLDLSGFEEYDVTGISEGLTPGKTVKVVAKDKDGNKKEFGVICRLDSPVEINYYKNGGILQTVLQQMISNN